MFKEVMNEWAEQMELFSSHYGSNKANFLQTNDIYTSLNVARPDRK